MNHLLRNVLSCATACLLTIATHSYGQEYPHRPIQMVVPNSPGTGQDTLARWIAPEMAKFLGQPVIVINKPGADFILGFEYVAKTAPADGYTLVVTSVSNLAILPSIFKQLPFDPLKDLTPFVGFVTQRFVLGSPVSKPWRNMREFVDYAKANPGKLNYGTASPNIRLGSAAVVNTFGLNMERINYPGGGPYLLALVRGEIDTAFLQEQQATEKVRVLAVSGATRAPAFPEAPTYTELGLPDLPGIDYSLNVRAGTPKAIMDKLFSATAYALRQPTVRENIEKAQWTIVERNAEAEAANLARQASLFADIARKAGIEQQ